MTTFAEATRVVRSGDSAYAWHVPEGWAQGRGAWGGLAVAAFVGAIVDSEPDPARVVRSVSAEIAAPARVGPVTITTRLLRKGSALSLWNAMAHDLDGGLIGSLSAVLAAPRQDLPEISGWGLPGAPAVAAADDVAVVPLRAPLGPEFMQHLEFRPIDGLPLAAAQAQARGWIRLEAPVPHTSASLLALVDAWWPATLPALDSFRPLATVNFSANLLVDPASVPGDQPLLHVGHASGVIDGYVSETRQLWTADGRLAVDNLQSIVLIA
ncbi:MAG: thioesterase family protein [Actinomycetota bacterium]|nr:thioesterase family protein [Actinomycetota bacterium]